MVLGLTFRLFAGNPLKAPKCSLLIPISFRCSIYLQVCKQGLETHKWPLDKHNNDDYRPNLYANRIQITPPHLSFACPQANRINNPINTNSIAFPTISSISPLSYSSRFNQAHNINIMLCQVIKICIQCMLGIVCASHEIINQEQSNWHISTCLTAKLTWFTKYFRSCV